MAGSMFVGFFTVSLCMDNSKSRTNTTNMYAAIFPFFCFFAFFAFLAYPYWISYPKEDNIPSCQRLIYGVYTFIFIYIYTAYIYLYTQNTHIYMSAEIMKSEIQFVLLY